MGNACRRLCQNTFGKPGHWIKDICAADRPVYWSFPIVEVSKDFTHPLTAGPAVPSDTTLSEQAQCPLLRLAFFSVNELECAKGVSKFLYGVVWTELTIVAGSETCAPIHGCLATIVSPL